MTTLAYGTQSEKEPLRLMEIQRREVGPTDVEIEIDYCGVCHTDIHLARNEWGRSLYPIVPGHEIVGRVGRVGAQVKTFSSGQLVGVGCMVDSCQRCSSCGEGLEQYCEQGMTATYNGHDPHLDQPTFGGYSKKIVVDEKFVLRLSQKLSLSAQAPLLCAGITTYSPLKHWNVQKGDRVGVIGLGGLGHMGVKFAKAMGAEVVVLTRSKSKYDEAKDLGADSVLLSTDEAAMEKNMGSFDFLLNTIPVAHDPNPYLMLLKRDATMVIVGAIEPLEKIHGGLLVMGRKRVAGSLIGGIKETQEMLDFCDQHGIVCDIEMIEMKEINQAYERMLKSDVKYRFVIDLKSLS